MCFGRLSLRHEGVLGIGRQVAVRIQFSHNVGVLIVTAMREIIFLTWQSRVKICFASFHSFIFQNNKIKVY